MGSPFDVWSWTGRWWMSRRWRQKIDQIRNSVLLLLTIIGQDSAAIFATMIAVITAATRMLVVYYITSTARFARRRLSRVRRLLTPH
jgi:hypothetical protein